MLYGIGVKSLAESLEITQEKAAEFQESFKKKYLGVTKYLENVVLQCRKKLYIETICGRRRYFPQINSKDHSERSAAERCAINTICQGSAADLVKIAMIRICRRLQDDSRISHIPCHIFKRESGSQASGKAYYSQLPSNKQCFASSSRLVLQIHDELLFEIPLADLDIVKVFIWILFYTVHKLINVIQT